MNERDHMDPAVHYAPSRPSCVPSPASVALHRIASRLDGFAAFQSRPGACAELQTLASELRTVATALLEPAVLPRRDDPVAAWLKRCRDIEDHKSDPWHAIDALLDEYRDHADYGVPMDRTIHEPPCDMSEGCPDCNPRSTSDALPT